MNLWINQLNNVLLYTLIMLVCIGSLNPAKISAVKHAYDQYYDGISFYKINADSRVSDQPIGLKKILKGAHNRAQSALNYLKDKEGLDPADQELYGVGIEAGLVKIPMAQTNYMDFQFCIITDKNKETTIGSGIGFEYPEFVINKIFSKETEVGEIMGKLSGNENLKKEGGAIGFLSKNVIKRENILEEAVICALLPRINESLYSQKK
jgi:inosine/xanthosine triphosphatase